MSAEILSFIDTVALPCCAFYDVLLKIESREDLATFAAGLDGVCRVSEEIGTLIFRTPDNRTEEFGRGSFVKKAVTLANALPKVPGVENSTEIENRLRQEREIVRNQALDPTYVESWDAWLFGPGGVNSDPRMGGSAGGVGAGAGAVAASAAAGTAAEGRNPKAGVGTGFEASAPPPLGHAAGHGQKSADVLGGAGASSGGIGGAKMNLPTFLSRTPVPCEIVMCRRTADESVESRERIAKWICWKGDWYR